MSGEQMFEQESTRIERFCSESLRPNILSLI